MNNNDYFQNLLKNSAASVSALGAWTAPTWDPKEIDKRIQELRTVQFWLEQNSKLLTATIQALEVQKLTLSTLQSINITPRAFDSNSASLGSEGDSAQSGLDPLQCWSALTQQFTQIAAQAMQDSLSSVKPLRESTDSPGSEPTSASESSKQQKPASKSAQKKSNTKPSSA